MVVSWHVQVCCTTKLSIKGRSKANKYILLTYFTFPLLDNSHQPYTRKHDLDELFKVIKDRHMDTSLPVLHNIQHHDLLPRLRRYQQEAISWMVHQEKQQSDKKQSNFTLTFIYFTWQLICCYTTVLWDCLSYEKIINCYDELSRLSMFMLVYLN